MGDPESLDRLCMFLVLELMGNTSRNTSEELHTIRAGKAISTNSDRSDREDDPFIRGYLRHL